MIIVQLAAENAKQFITTCSLKLQSATITKTPLVTQRDGAPAYAAVITRIENNNTVPSYSLFSLVDLIKLRAKFATPVNLNLLG